MKKTKIICTIGPASDDPEIIDKFISFGMNAARLNFSHGDYEEHGKRIETIKKLREKRNIPIAIILDTKGPEIRTGNYKDGKVELSEGQSFIFTTRDIIGDETICSISYNKLPWDLSIGNLLLVDDGLIGFKVVSINDTEINCIVMNSGTLGNHKGVNIPGVSISMPALTLKDIDDIVFGINMGVDIIAASFIRKPADVISIRRILEKNNGSKILIISKIESNEAVDNIDEIIRFSDGIMVARGDLGVEIPVEEVPLVQKMIIAKCNRAGKPVITATQMLDSMIRNPRPTRAEASDVANAIFDGTDCIMLSGETANGKYPVEAVKIMSKIAERTEMSLNYTEMIKKRKPMKADNVTSAISYSTCTTAAELGASAIITATQSGHTARMVSKYRPEALLIATTPYEDVARKLSIVWGVYPIIAERMDSTDEVIEHSVNQAIESGYIKKGELVVIAAGIPVGFTGTTNMIKVHIAGDVLVMGQGVGKKSVYGNTCVINDISRADELINDGDIIIIKNLDKRYSDYLDRVSGIVAEESGITSQIAVECINRGIPFISGAENATVIIRNGILVTLDVFRGLVFNGKVNVI